MKIIPLNTILQRTENIKITIEEIVLKHKNEIKEKKNKYSDVENDVKEKVRELSNDLILSNDFAEKSSELTDMVKPKLDT